MKSDDQDIRWQQRLRNYALALQQLTDAAQLANQRPLTPLEQQGLIQAFKFTHELAWNVMKDYFYWQGNAGLTGSRDATREAFSKALVDDGEGWMEMIKSRNQSPHTYNQQIAELITRRYHPLYLAFAKKMQDISASA